jgi:hypothetical protein
MNYWALYSLAFVLESNTTFFRLLTWFPHLIHFILVIPNAFDCYFTFFCETFFSYNFCVKHLSNVCISHE